MSGPTNAPPRAPRSMGSRPALLLATLVALVLVAGCAAKEAATATPPSTASGATNATTTAPASAPPSTTATSAPTTTTTAPKKEVGNADIKAALSASAPELWALVNYDYMSWDAFGGYNIPVPTGTDAAKAIALCDAVAGLVHDARPETPIVIAVGVTADDIQGTPLVQRPNKAGTCAAA